MNGTADLSLYKYIIVKVSEILNNTIKQIKNDGRGFIQYAHHVRLVLVLHERLIFCMPPQRMQ